MKRGALRAEARHAVAVFFAMLQRRTGVVEKLATNLVGASLYI
jgi:hypothetical protein